VTNCTFSTNSADYGGGMYIWLGLPTVANSILWGNTATGSGAEVYNNASTPVFSYSCIEGGLNGAGCAGDALAVGTGNIGDLPAHAPVFVDAAGGNLRLSADPGCINMGSDALLPADVADLDDDGNVTEPLPLDLDGNPRVSGSFVDMGAYEYQQ